MKSHKVLGQAFAFLLAVSAQAVPVLTSGSWDGADRNLNHYFTTWGVDLDVNADQMAGSDYWDDTITPGSSAVMLLEVAGHASGNRFGIFEKIGNAITHHEIYAGAITPGMGTTTILAIPTGPFGFYLQYNNSYFYSDSTLNAYGAGQMVAYQGPAVGTTINTGIGSLIWDQQSYLLAFEDLPYHSSDKDFNDMVVMLRVSKVPDAGSTAALIVLGIVALVAARRRS